MMMYNLSPRLFFVSMSLPVPLSVIMAWVGVDRVRKLDRKISKVSDHAAAGTTIDRRIQERMVNTSMVDGAVYRPGLEHVPGTATDRLQSRCRPILPSWSTHAMPCVASMPTR